MPIVHLVVSCRKLEKMKNSAATKNLRLCKRKNAMSNRTKVFHNFTLKQDVASSFSTRDEATNNGLPDDKLKERPLMGATAGGSIQE